MTIPVKWFTSDMAGAPSLTNSAGSLITLLDNLLLSTGGFNTVTPDSIEIASNVATLTKSGGHGFIDGVVGLIEGATPSALDGEHRLTYVSSTVVSFATTGITDQTASVVGTIKMAPVGGGWEKSASDTNKGIYRSTASGSLGLYLSVDDSVGAYANVRGCEGYSDISTLTNPFPTTSQRATSIWHKSSASGNRTWVLVADPYGIHFLPFANSSVAAGMWFFFGDLATPNSGDSYATLATVAYNTSVTSDTASHIINNTGGARYLPRAATGTVGSVLAVYSSSYGVTTGSTMTTAVGFNGITYAGSLIACPLIAFETDYQGAWRGIVPGAYNPLSRFSKATLGNNLLVAGSVFGRPGLAVPVYWSTNDTPSILLDIYGPWR